MSSSTKIELYTNECYQCKPDTKYKALRDYVVANQIPLRNMVIKRTTLNQQWANEAREIGVEIPFVKVTKENGEVDCVNWNEFIEQNDEKPKRHVEIKDESSTSVVKLKKRNSAVDKRRTKNTSVLD